MAYTFPHPPLLAIRHLNWMVQYLNKYMTYYAECILTQQYVNGAIYRKIVICTCMYQAKIIR